MESFKGVISNGLILKHVFIFSVESDRAFEQCTTAPRQSPAPVCTKTKHSVPCASECPDKILPGISDTRMICNYLFPGCSTEHTSKAFHGPPNVHHVGKQCAILGKLTPVDMRTGANFNPGLTQLHTSYRQPVSGGMDMSKICSNPNTRLLPAQSNHMSQSVTANTTAYPHHQQAQRQQALQQHSYISQASGRISSETSAHLSVHTTDLSSRFGTQMSPYFMSYFRHHSTRASPVTVQWLLENYESADGVSLSRSALYSHYLGHCLEHWLEPMNPASFGKLIRSIFLGLRTRRLGTRGNSKYHYYGIRIKATSALNHQVPGETRSLTYHKKEPYSSSTRIGSGATNGLAVSTTSRIELHRSASISNTTRYLASERFKPFTGAGARSSSLGSDTGCNQRDSGREKGQLTSYNTPPVWRGWDYGSCSRVRGKVHGNVDYIKTGISMEVCCASTIMERDGTHSQNARTPNLGNSAAAVDSQCSNLDLLQTSHQSIYSTTWGDYSSSTRGNQTINIAEERTYFGAASDQTFIFPKLTELCQMAGLLITEADLLVGAVKLEPFEFVRQPSGSNMGKQSNNRELIEFIRSYETHCQKVYVMIVNLRLDELRTIWHQFWRSTEGSSGYQESQLSKSQLMSLCERPGVCQFVELADRSLYQALLEVIISDSLKAMPANLIHGVRVLIKIMEPCLRSAIRQFNPSLINTKLTVLSGFTKGLRRALGLTHLSQAVVGVIRDPERLRQMLCDIKKLDLDCIEAQGSWASDCPFYNEQRAPLHMAQLAQSSNDPSSDFSSTVDFESLLALPSNPLGGWESDNGKSAIVQHSSVIGSQNRNQNSIKNVGNTNSSAIGLTTWTDQVKPPISVTELHAEVCGLLISRATLSTWTVWLDQIVARSLANRVSGPKRANAARQLMLVWTYYSSLLMRELTLRSAVSFSSCHLLRMLCDEYLSYRLEQVASSPLTPLPRISEYLPVTYPMDSLDMLSQPDGIIEHTLLASEQTNTLTSLNDTNSCLVDSQTLAPDYADRSMPNCSPPPKNLCHSETYFETKSPEFCSARLLGQDMSELERPGNYFSLGFCGDPLLTESNSLTNDKPISLSDITDNWTNPDSLSTMVTNSGLSYPLHERPLTPQTNGLGSEYLNSPNLGPVGANDMCTSELNATMGINPKPCATPEPSTENRPPSMSGCVAQSRSHRKPLKQQLSRFQEQPKLFENLDTDETLQLAVGTFKMEHSEWLELSSNQLDHGTQGVAPNSSLHEVSPASRRFMKPSSSHVEKRIVASLHDEVQEVPNIQNSRKTVCITLGAEEFNHT
ncbi:hypothetical protein PHET_02443 [Paragonimus heterotremus]|uniref:RFX-type winged-helix domain-containing protein n=1 Tax=Paragonimus heterotremus TaxID=100268 RepID=A0A8J4TJ48_9TREM|nr:hypothetical protein PHET_02443 [Paragonimus heterotremus]